MFGKRKRTDAERINEIAVLASDIPDADEYRDYWIATAVQKGRKFLTGDCDHRPRALDSRRHPHLFTVRRFHHKRGDGRTESDFTACVLCMAIYHRNDFIDGKRVTDERGMPLS